MKNLTDSFAKTLKIYVSTAFRHRNRLGPKKNIRFPFDYYLWGVVEKETKKHLVTPKIMADFNNLSKRTAQMNCRRFQSREEAVVNVNGDFF